MKSIIGSLLLLALLFLCYSPLSCQSSFQKVIGTTGSDIGYSLLSTNDNKVILTGLTERFGGQDILLLELDQEANIIWSKALGGTQDDFARTIIQTLDGGFVIVGSTESFGQGQRDMFILKTDRNGGTEWAKSLGGSEEERGFSVIQTEDGGYAIGGSTTSLSFGKRDAILYRLDGQGNLLWSKTYGGFDNDNIFNLKQTQDGGLIFTAVQFSFGAGSHDFWVVRLDALGQVLWAKSYGGNDEEHARVILPTPDGNFLVVGHTRTFGVGGWDFLLLKISPEGDLLWAKTYGEVGDELSGSLTIKDDGNLLIYGFSTSFSGGDRDAIVIETNQDGQVIGSTVFGSAGDDFPQFGPDSPLIMLSDSDFLATGVKSIGQFGGQDIFLIKTRLTHPHNCESEDIAIQETAINNVVSTDVTPSEASPPAPLDFTPMESFITMDEILICPPPIAKIHAPDTLICVGDCINLIDSSLNDPTSFQWEIPGGQPAIAMEANVNNVCFTSAGTFEVRLIVANDFGLDTAFQTIIVNPMPMVDLGDQTNLCEGGSLTLSAFTSNASYLWQDNSEASDFVVTEGGNYSVTVSLENCEETGSISIEEIACEPPVAIINTSSTDICAGECITVIDSSLNNPTSITWSFPGAQPPMSSQPVVVDICYPAPGTYSISLLVSNEFGMDTAMQTIQVKATPDLDLGEDQLICEGDSIILSAFTDNANYSWQDGSDEPLFTATSSGLYSVIVDLEGCQAEDEINLTTQNCTRCEFFIPNAFSPNDDGINDEFIIFSNCAFESYNIKIFDRWGELLFENNDPNVGWNGIFRSQPMVSAVFTYYITVSFQELDRIQSEILTGAVTLIR